MIISFYTITSFINFLTSVVLAILVILKNRKNPKNIAFFILAMLIGLWSLSYFFWQNITDNAETALFWCRALMMFVIIIPAAYLHFALAITETLKEKKSILIFTYFLFYGFLLTNMTPHFIKSVEPIMNFRYWPMATPIMSAYLFLFTVCVVYSSFLLIKKYRTSVGIIRIQIKYVAIGFIIAMISGSFNFLPWFKISVPPLGNALVPVYVIAMAYAITRYRLMNIKILSRNILFYFGIVFFIYVAFYFVAYAYRIAFGDVFAKEGYLTGLFVAPIFAVAMYSSGKFLYNFMNKYVFTSIYTYQQIIKNASYKLGHYADLNEISDIIIDSIKRTLQSNDIAVLFFDELNGENNQFKIIKKIGFEKNDFSSIEYNLFSEYFKKEQEIITREELDQIIQNSKDQEAKKIFHSVENQIYKNNIFICVPLKDDKKLLGMIVIGIKPYEDSYFQEDFSLLETLSHQAQVTMNNAILYKRLEEKNKALMVAH